jgi:hypothetical protein
MSTKKNCCYCGTTWGLKAHLINNNIEDLYTNFVRGMISKKNFDKNSVLKKKSKE